VIGLFFRFCFRLRQFSLHCIIKDGATSGIGRKWKRSDSSDSDSVELMTPLTIPIFDFHQVISSLMTPTTTPTPSLVKTRIKLSQERVTLHNIISGAPPPDFACLYIKRNAIKKASLIVVLNYRTQFLKTIDYVNLYQHLQATITFTLI